MTIAPISAAVSPSLNCATAASFTRRSRKKNKLDTRCVSNWVGRTGASDGLKRGKDDQPTIGILLGTEIRETDVKYSIISECDRMLAVKLLPYMPTKEELIAEIEYARGHTATRKTRCKKKSDQKKN